MDGHKSQMLEVSKDDRWTERLGGFNCMRLNPPMMTVGRDRQMVVLPAVDASGGGGLAGMPDTFIAYDLSIQLRLMDGEPKGLYWLKLPTVANKRGRQERFYRMQ